MQLGASLPARTSRPLSSVTQPVLASRRISRLFAASSARRSCSSSCASISRSPSPSRPSAAVAARALSLAPLAIRAIATCADVCRRHDRTAGGIPAGSCANEEVAVGDRMRPGWAGRAAAVAPAESTTSAAPARDASARAPHAAMTREPRLQTLPSRLRAHDSPVASTDAAVPWMSEAPVSSAPTDDVGRESLRRWLWLGAAPRLVWSLRLTDWDPSLGGLKTTEATPPVFRQRRRALERWLLLRAPDRDESSSRRAFDARMRATTRARDSRSRRLRRSFSFSSRSRPATVASMRRSSSRSRETAKLRPASSRAMRITTTSCTNDQRGRSRHERACSHVNVFTSKPESADTTNSSQSLGTCTATKSVRWSHAQPMASSLPLSATVVQPSVLQAAACASHQRHSSADSQYCESTCSCAASYSSLVTAGPSSSLSFALISNRAVTASGWPMHEPLSISPVSSGSASSIGADRLETATRALFCRSENETSGDEVVSSADSPPCVLTADTYSSSPTVAFASTAPCTAVGSNTVVVSMAIGAAESSEGGRACTVRLRLGDRTATSSVNAVPLAVPLGVASAALASSPISSLSARDSVAAPRVAAVAAAAAVASAVVLLLAVASASKALTSPSRDERTSAELWPSVTSTDGTASSTAATLVAAADTTGLIAAPSSAASLPPPPAVEAFGAAPSASVTRAATLLTSASATLSCSGTVLSPSAALSSLSVAATLSAEE